MTNQESIECTCRVGTVVTDGRVDGDEVIIHGPCHSPGPEVWAERATLLARNEALEQALRDFSEHGLRADLHPTSIDGLPGGRPWEEYLQRIDSTVRARARKALINGEGK